MNATKTSFQTENGNYVEWDANGSLPALKWTDANGNNWRAMGSYQFDNNNETYTIIVNKFIQLVGESAWNLFSTYPITATDQLLRVFNTGQVIKGNYRGEYDASSNLFPSTGGSGAAGAIVMGDNWIASVAGVLGGVVVNIGDPIIAKADAPGQDATKWEFAIVWALDTLGNIVEPTGWVGSAKYFTVMIGYNPYAQPVSINYYVYLEIAEEEGLTIV